MMNPRFYTTSYDKRKDSNLTLLSFLYIKLQYTEKSCKIINIFVLVTILGHLPVILSAKRKGSDNMKQILIVEDDLSLIHISMQLFQTVWNMGSGKPDLEMTVFSMHLFHLEICLLYTSPSDNL